MTKNDEKEELRKDLRYLSGERVEKQIFDRIVFYEGEYKVEHMEYDMVFDPILRKWISHKSEAKISYLPLETWRPKISQDLEFTIYFRRHAWDSNLKPIQAIFEQKMKLKATLPDEFFSFYNGSIVRTFLDSGVSDIVSVRDPRIEKIGSERRLSDKEVQELIKNKTLIYDENPVEGLVLNL
jgi:hypothetical protein